MGVSLVLVQSDGRQNEVELKKPIQVIGRQTDCQIRIPSAGISRHHCEVSLAEGKIGIRDLGSSNGTFVNRRRITQAELAAGDLIAIGDMVFVVRVDGNPSKVDGEEAYEEGVVHITQSPSTPDARTTVAPPKADAAPRKPMSAIEDDDFAATPKKRGGLLDEDEGDADGSSVGDFDFLDDDDDIKKQPKL